PTAEPALRAVEALLQDRLGRARAAWPSLQVQEPGFLRFIAARGDPQSSPEVNLRALRFSDLYLVFACLSGSAEAMGLLERTFLPDVRLQLRRLQLETRAVDET